MLCFGEAALSCSVACRDAKVLLAGFCYDRIPERRLGPIFERRRFGERVHSFKVEVFHFSFYLVYSFARQWLASTTGIDVPALYKVILYQGIDWG